MHHIVIILGNLGRDPEMRYMKNGEPVTNFNVAANRQYTNKSGEKVKETVWFRVSVFGGAAEACNEYLKAGSAVMVEGRLVPDPDTGGPKVYETKDGEYGASFEVIASTVKFLSKPSSGDDDFDADKKGNKASNGKKPAAVRAKIETAEKKARPWG